MVVGRCLVGYMKRSVRELWCELGVDWIFFFGRIYGQKNWKRSVSFEASLRPSVCVCVCIGSLKRSRSRSSGITSWNRYFHGDPTGCNGSAAGERSIRRYLSPPTTTTGVEGRSPRFFFTILVIFGFWKSFTIQWFVDIYMLTSILWFI